MLTKFEERRPPLSAGQRLAQLAPGTAPDSEGERGERKQAKVQADVVRIKHMDVSFPGDVITTFSLPKRKSANSSLRQIDVYGVATSFIGLKERK